jgi:hypothetical protein
MQQQFLFEADQQSHFPITKTVNDTIALYSSPMCRLADLGADALTEIDALSLLLDTSNSTLAGELLAEYGSLNGLARASSLTSAAYSRKPKLPDWLPRCSSAPCPAKIPLPKSISTTLKAFITLSVRKCAPLIAKSSPWSCLIPAFG